MKNRRLKYVIMNVYDQIQIIRYKSKVFFVSYNLSNISTFIHGILFSNNCNDSSDKFDVKYLRYFNWFVNYKLLKMKISKEVAEDLSYNNGRGFSQLIPVVESNNEKQIDLFYFLLDEFYNAYQNQVDFEEIINSFYKEKRN